MRYKEHLIKEQHLYSVEQHSLRPARISLHAAQLLLMYGTALNLMAAAARTFDTAQGTGVTLPVQLDRVPAMLQFALDSHAVGRDHVQYQSVERWLLGAFGMADAEPNGHFDNLLEHGVVQRALFGAASCHLAHGPGFTDSYSCNTPADYLHSHNSGSFSECTIKRGLPASAKPGPQLHCLLNLFKDVRCNAGAVTYSPCEGCLNTLVTIGYDGMNLGKGAMLIAVQLASSVGLQSPQQIISSFATRSVN